MKTKDLYQTINAMVRKHTGIEMPSLIFSNKEECVDARYILVYFLAQFLTDDEISRHTNLKRQSINHIRNNFECKLQKWSVKNCTSEISRELADKQYVSIAIIRLFVSQCYCIVL